MRKVVAASMCMLFAMSCHTEKSSRQQVKRLPGTWQASPIVIDGKRNDWPVPYPFENSKALISYAISNDKNNLYITVETGDLATQLKILRRGLVVWVDRSASRKQEGSASVCYPADNEHGRTTVAATRDLGKQVDEALATTNEFFLNGVHGCKGKFRIEAGDTCGIKVGIGLDEFDQLVWEAVIPFKTFYPKGQLDRRDMGKPVDICFDILGLERPAGMAGNGGNGPRFGVGMGGFGMGGGMMMGGGGGRRSSGDAGNEQLYKTTSTWQEIGLAWVEQAPN